MSYWPHLQPKRLLTGRSGAAKITIASCATMGAVALFLVFAHTNGSANVKAYFRAEQMLIAHWPERWGKSVVEQFAIHRLAPKLCDLGLLRPARIHVEPEISFLLDPRDLIAASILRGGEWQPEIWDAILPVLSDGAVFLDV